MLRLAAAALAEAATPAVVRGQIRLAGAPTPEPLRRELHQALAAAIERFQALDAAGVLTHVAEHYRNGPFTKRSLREHLLAMFTLYDAVRARVRVDEVRLVDGNAWVYSSGEVSGRVRGLGAWTSALAWVREPEVARKDGGAWRLIGPGP